MGLGFQSLKKVLGQDMPIRVWTDSSAAIGICTRQGLAHLLWMQQAVCSGRVDLRKILGEKNPADFFTKHSISGDRLEKPVALFDCQFTGGRAEAAPQTLTGTSGRKTIAQADSQVHAVEARSGTEDSSGQVSPLAREAQPESSDRPHGEYNPQMPHNSLSTEELDRRYPSLEAVEDLDLPDLSLLEDEQLYTAGMAVVQDILHEMSQVGRTRPQGDRDQRGQTNAPELEGGRRGTRSGGSDRDRSGFGPR